MKELRSISGKYFDTINVITCDVDDVHLQNALDLCKEYEGRLSRFTPGSDVWRINHAEGQTVTVSDDTSQILACAEQVRTDSGGAFNVAIGSVAALWDFSGETAVIPSPEALAEAQRIMDQAIICLNGNEVTVPSNTTIDLGGIAKGYICDRVAEFLREKGASKGILNFGGNVVTIGEHPEGRPWQVGLQTPTAERNKGVFAVVDSSGGSVVTSGVYERAFVLDGKVYHHILDPRSCWPVENNILSATVAAEDGMVADALATALLILGAEQGLTLVKRYGADALTLDAQGKIHATEGLRFQLIRS